MISKKKKDFESSARLKELFQLEYDKWRKKNGEDLTDLAAKCGVSPAYLAHVRRYGRIPSKPVLILIALNFGVPGQKFFDAAEVGDKYPYSPELTITRQHQEENALFGFQFNTQLFTDTIRNIVRSEVKSRSARDLLADRPLRIGLNYHQYWLFAQPNPPLGSEHSGIFPEFCRMIGLALQKDVELLYVPFSQYLERLTRGEIDLFGPTMPVPNLPEHIPYTHSIYRMGISALARQRKAVDLPELPLPNSIEMLRDPRYQIAVLQNSLPHLLAITKLKRSDDSLIFCASDEEAIDRILLKGVSKPAHIFLTNSITAALAAKKSTKDIKFLFNTKKTLLDLAENAIAVRPDLPEVIPLLNEAIRFVLHRGGMDERFGNLLEAEFSELVDIQR